METIKFDEEKISVKISSSSIVNIDDAIQKFFNKRNQSLSTRELVQLIDGKVTDYQKQKNSIRNRIIPAVNQLFNEGKKVSVEYNKEKKEVFLFVIHNRNLFIPVVRDTKQKIESDKKTFNHVPLSREAD